MKELLILDAIAIVAIIVMIAVLIYFFFIQPAIEAKKEKIYKRKNTWTIVFDNDDEVVYVNEDGDEFHQFRNS